jgi:hypothetical protein
MKKNVLGSELRIADMSVSIYVYRLCSVPYSLRKRVD